MARRCSSYTAVVPAKAGTHNHRCPKEITVSATSHKHGVWVPAFAGTTKRPLA
jgi:hypothetical protein